MQCPARGRAHEFRIVGERVLRLRNADGQVTAAPLGKMIELFSGLVTDRHILRAVDFFRDTLNFLRQGFVQRIDGLYWGYRVRGDSFDDAFGKIFRSKSSSCERFRDRADDTVLRAEISQPFQIRVRVVRENG